METESCKQGLRPERGFPRRYRKKFSSSHAIALGTMRAKPLWTEIMEHLSEAEERPETDYYLEIRNQLYDDE
jgi:hypothetical protein